MLEILFARGEATLAEVGERMEAPPSRPALRSIVKGLEAKGQVVESGKRGREILYRPRRRRDREGRAAWKRVLETFFGGSLRDGLAAYLSDPRTSVDEDDLRELEKMIREARERGPEGGRRS